MERPAAKRIKILHVLSSNIFSGAENVACQIIDLFKDNDGFDFAYCSPDGPVKEILADRGVSFLPVKTMRFREIQRAVRAFDPDVIHSHDVKASVLSAMCRGRAKLICTIHSNDLRMRSLNIKSLSTLLFAKEAEHIFWVSRSCFDGFVFKRLIGSKSSILYNVVNYEEICKKVSQDTNEYDYDAVYVGRLTAQKNPKRLVEVLKLAVLRCPDMRFAVIGSGDLEDQVEAMLKAESLQSNVNMLGFMANPLKAVSRAKALLLTSDWEGTPMVVLEAAALGVPVISTPVDGICEFVTNGVNGYLSEDAEALAEKLVECIADAKASNELSANAMKAFFLRNDISNYKKTLLQYYSL